MAFPAPVPGLVIRYSYLWRREHLQGREEARKDRPCAIIAAVHARDGDDTRVLVLPITHAPPARAVLAVEIPAKVKARLGLDEDRSWIVLTEWNAFVWPGPDLRPAPGVAPPSIAYGMLPPGLFTIVQDQFLDVVKTGRARQVPRT
jgi:hypothetical protein